MKHAARLVLVFMLLAALPLRGYAGVLMTLCESHHGGAVAVGEHEHEQGASHEHDDDGGTDGQSHAATVCGMCASCCVGAGLASEAKHGFSLQPPAAHRIPFLGRQVSGFVPEHLDRPPLAL